MLKKILKKLTQKVVAGSKNKATKAVWKQNRKPSKINLKMNNLIQILSCIQKKIFTKEFMLKNPDYVEEKSLYDSRGVL